MGASSRFTQAQSGSEPGEAFFRMSEKRREDRFLGKVYNAVKREVVSMMIRIRNWIVVFIFIVVLVYTGWVIVALNRTATISIDYVALLNEKATSVPEHERAWPSYREVSIAIRENPMPGGVFLDEEIEEPAWPDEQGWNHFEDWLATHSDTLTTLHTATSKSGFGFILQGHVSEEDKELWPDEYASQQSEELLDGFVVSVLLPQLGPMRQMAFLLSVDAKSAAANGDASRCLQDIQSLLQIGTHVREHSLLISDLVSHSIYVIAFSTLGDIVAHAPTTFSKDQITTIRNDLASLEDKLSIRLDGERYFMYDLLQRIYTDDGNGDGRIIPVDATKLIAFTETVSSDSANSSLIPVFLAPIADICYASRKEMHDEYNRRLNFTEEQSLIPLHELKQQNSLYNTPWESAKSTLDPYFLVDLLVPALEKAMLQGKYTRAKRDATLAVLFAVQTYNETGRWPTDLTGAGVVDAWNGKPLLITFVDGKPIIYSVGFNQEDDNAQFDSKAFAWEEKSDGDWIIWPSPE